MLSTVDNNSIYGLLFVCNVTECEKYFGEEKLVGGRGGVHNILKRKRKRNSLSDFRIYFNLFLKVFNYMD